MVSLHTGWTSSPWWWKRPSPHSLTLAPLKPDSLVPACVLSCSRPGARSAMELLIERLARDTDTNELGYRMLTT